ncbi:MAG: hypothetical protein AAF684_04360 [Pseudomonadota bacterium]
MAIDPSSTPVGTKLPHAATADQRGESASVWGDDGFTFGDVLDVVNPLQHLPVVSMIYRELTGDTISQGSRLVGGLLFGGPSGAVFAALDTAIEAESGRSFAGNIAHALYTGVTGGSESDEIVNPDPNTPGQATINAAALSDAEFWAMRMAPTDPRHPPDMVVGPVLTPPLSSPTPQSDLDIAQIAARTTTVPMASVEPAAAPSGYLTGGAAQTPTTPSPQLSAPIAPVFDAAEADAETVFAEMMRGLDRYDALRADEDTEDG